MMAAGLIVMIAAVLSAIFLYRTLRFGWIMYLLPYLLCVIGALLLYAQQGAESIWVTLILTSVVFAIHITVVFDIRKTRKMGNSKNH